MKSAMDATAVVRKPGGWLGGIVHTQRRKLLDAFRDFSKCVDGDTVLSIAYSSNEDRLSSSSVLSLRKSITTYRVGSPAGSTSFRLPFATGEFDWVFCDEVLEYMGDFERQCDVVRELHRVARKGVFLTASNRQHPFEFHTGLPFCHWLPQALWVRILAALRQPKLHLLDGPALYRLAEQLPGQPWHDVGHKRVLGIKAHFFLMVEKRKSGAST